MPPRSSLSEMIAQKRKEAKKQQQQQSAEVREQPSTTTSSVLTQQEWDAKELDEWLNKTTPQQRRDAVVVAYDDILASKCHISSNGRYPERPNRLSRAMDLLRSTTSAAAASESSSSSLLIRRMPPPNISDLKIFLDHLQQGLKDEEKPLTHNRLDKSVFTEKEKHFLTTLIHTSPELRAFINSNKPFSNISTDLFIDEETSLEGTLRAAALTIEATRGVWERSESMNGNNNDNQNDNNNSSFVDQWKHAFALIRPPGHHSGPDKCHGFCLVNHVAAAAASLMFDEDKNQKKKKKIVILDIDVHHGDGTQSICDELMKMKKKDETNDELLFFSMHRYDQGNFFPKTGHLDSFGDFGLNFNLGFDTFCAPSVLKQIRLEKLKKKEQEDQNQENAAEEEEEQQQQQEDHRTLLEKYPFYRVICDDTVKIVVDEFLIPLLFSTSVSFNPDIILISCGFDAADGDPLGGQGVSKFGYRYFVERIAKMSSSSSQNTNTNNKKNPGIVCVLEGGYDVDIVSTYFNEIVVNGLAGGGTGTHDDSSSATLLVPPSHFQKGRTNFVENPELNNTTTDSSSFTDDDQLRKLNQDWTRKTILDLCQKYVDRFSKSTEQLANEDLLKFCSAFVLQSQKP